MFLGEPLGQEPRHRVPEFAAAWHGAGHPVDAVDEPVETLGKHLKLPAFLEKHRGEIERVLPVLETEKVTS